MSCILVITNGNYFAQQVLRPLMLSRHGEDTRVVLASGAGHLSSRGTRSSLLRSWGLRYATYKLGVQYGLPILGRLLRKPLTVRQLAAREGSPCEVVPDANSPDFLARLGEIEPDLIVSVSCPHRLTNDILDSARIGSINVHTSLLPAYAGVSTYVHMLAEHPPVVGVTVHEMIERLDAGVVLGQQRTAIEPGESVFGFFSRLCVLGGGLLKDVVEDALLSGRLVGSSQDLAARSYRPEPTAADIKAARRRGHRLLHTAELIKVCRA